MSEWKPKQKMRQVFGWEFIDGTSFRVTGDAETAYVLDMLETLIALKRAELAKQPLPLPPSTGEE